MKILIIRMFPNVININNYNVQEIGLARALVKKGYVCDIVLYTKGQEYEDYINIDNEHKIKIYYLNAKNFINNAFFSNKLYDIVKKYDIVQTSEYDQIQNLILRKYCKKMIIYHGPYASNYTKGYNKKIVLSDLLYKFSKEYKYTTCITKSNLAKEFLIKKGFKDITAIGVGIDQKRFEVDNIEKDSFVSKVIKEKGKSKYLLYIGKIEERRNILFLLGLLNELKNNDVKLVIIGDGKEKYKNDCKEYIKKLGLEKYILYKKELKQTDIIELYKNSDLFILPTKYEIFGMVLLEAMYFGLPCITSINGGSSTIIKSGVNGMIMKKFDKNSWIDSIKELLYDDKARKEIGISARKTIINNFLWDKLVDNFIEVYRNEIKC